MKTNEFYLEVKEFFKKDTFSLIELNLFKQKLKSLDSKIDFKKIEAAINFHLINYTSSSIVVSEKNIEESNINIKTEIRETSNKSFNKYNYSINKLSQELNVSIDFITKLLIQKGIEINDQKIISKQELKTIEGYIHSRKKALKRMQKVEKIYKDKPVKKSKNVYNSRSIKVYDKIASNGLSKVIYIRAK